MNKTMHNFEETFTEKYKLYGDMLYKIAFLYTGNPSDAEDVLQDVFTKFFYIKKDFTSQEHEKAWFIRITQNKSIDYIRKRKGSCELYLEKGETTAETLFSDSDLKEDILSQIAKLDKKYKTVVILYYYYDYSIKDIAGTLKISTEAVKKRLQRSREQLKVEMEDYNL